MADQPIPPITSVVELDRRLLGLARKINPETNELDESAFKLLSPTQRLGLDAEFARYLADNPISGGGTPTVRAGYVMPSLAKFRRKMDLSPGTVKLLSLGDSTQTFAGGPSTRIPELIARHSLPGGVFEGFDIANLLDFGQNGLKLEDWLGQTGDPTQHPKGRQAVNAAKADVEIISWLINDTRSNLTLDEAGMLAFYRPMLRTLVDQRRADNPDGLFVLRQPTALLSVSYFNYILPGVFGSVAEKAAAASRVMYQLYAEYVGLFDNVFVLLLQDTDYGRESLPESPLMEDELHARPDAYVNRLMQLLGKWDTFWPEYARRANEIAFSAPWTVYQRAMEDKKYWLRVAEGITLKAGQINGSYFDVGVENKDAALAKELIRGGDVVSVGGGEFIFRADNVEANGLVNIKFNGTFPQTDFQGAKVEVYRHRYGLIEAAKPYLDNLSDFPYRRHVLIGAAGNQYIIIKNTLDDGIITPRTIDVDYRDYKLRPTDVLVASNGAVIPLTNAEIINRDPVFGQLRINTSGDWSAIQNQPAFVFGSHPYEDEVVLLGDLEASAVAPTHRVKIQLPGGQQVWLPVTPIA